MASQSDHPNAFGIRIVSMDYYMSPPIPDLDICYSSFQGGLVAEVPVIRIYGSTLAGQKTCLHVHRALPYLYVSCSDVLLRTPQEGYAYTQLVCHAMEKALKGGAVLNKSFQPHEAHFPYLLQLLVDYNLYGMGLIHLSKVKFRHPLPAKFVPRAVLHRNQYRNEHEHEHDIEKSSCDSGSFQADSSSEASPSLAVWLSSTIRGDWMWTSPAIIEHDSSPDQGMHHIRRQSTCELEADATVDEILNQQCKMYTSLSQTRSEVKMVQSLVPIWEEEYERTGIHEMVISPDSSKPLPENVLRTFLNGLEFDAAFLDLCMDAQNSFLQVTPHEGENFAKSIRSLTDLDDSSALEKHVSSKNSREISTKFPAEENEIGYASAGGSLSEGLDAKPSDEMGRFHGLSPIVEEMLSTEMTGTSNSKVADVEALGLLRWLASSQAVDDLCTDDELIHEAILSPWLPITTIDKVLEKAHLDYESESQKECQDILDSVEVKEQAPCRVNHRPSAGVSSEHTIPQADGSFDGPFTMQTGNSSETEMNNEVGKSSPHSSLEVSGKGHGKHRQKKRLWGSLPFSTRQKVHGDSEFAPPNSTEAFSDEVRNFTDASSSASSELESRNDASIIDTVPEFSHLKDRKIMAGCSVRDLMRRKRKYQVEPSEFRNHKIRKMVSAMEQNEEIRVSPERYSLQNVKHSVISCELSDVELLASGHVVAIQERNSGAVPCGSVAVSKHSRPRPTSYNACRYGKLPFPSCTGRSLQAGAFPNDHFGFCEGLRDRESSSKLASSDIHSHEPDLLASGLKLKSDGEETSCEGLTCVQVPPPSNLTNAPCDSGSSIKDNNKDKEGHVATEGIEMTFIRQAPIVDWSGWNYGDASVENAGQNHEFLGDVENHGRTLAYNSSFQCFNGRDSDDLPPFFANNYQERREFYYESFRSRENPDFRQENALGIPTHYKNDGSLLYLLTPAFLPPTSQCVHQWLMQLRHQSTTNMSAGILGTSMVNVQEALMEPPSPKYDSSLRVIDGENSCFDNERSLSELSKMHAVSSIDIRNPQGFLGDACCRSHPVLGSSFSSKFDFNKSNQDDNRDSWMDINPDHANKLATESQCNRVNVKEKRCSKNWQESSQISGPDTKSKLTPLSQTGFRDPASIGAGQQLTLLSVEVLAESRGDLRPNPQFDAINVVTLIIQEDSSPNFEVYVLLRVNDVESCQRNLDGVYGCKLVIVSEEKLLFDHFVKIICSLDPDILMGWEIQGSSLGFLAERAAHLGVSLLKTISRTPAFETKVAAGDSNNPGKETANNLPLDAIGESVVLEDAIIKDEWGRTHASGIHVGGRIVLNIWRIMRSEVKLNMYTIETVAEAVLRRKIPSIPCKALAKWFSSGPARARFRCIEYVIGRAKLNLEIMNQLDVINRTSELARVFGIDFFSVLSRGSQYRVESMFLRLAHTQNYLALSPGSQQVASQPAMECLPLVMEPESGFYVDPVIVLDFQSLYPSMIIAYNLCFCTCLGKVMPSKANTLGVSSFSPDPQTLVDLKDQILLTPNGVMYVPPKVRKGVLPRLLEEILSTRIMVKKAMKKLEPSQRVLHRIFNARQLALKLIANVTYGYTAAGFSGRMPCAELADSIVQCGRKTLETAISFVNAHEKWNARVVYGDTDSMFVVLKGRTVEQAFQIGQEIASAITAMNPSPVTLKMEKVYYPCVLLTKKRYVGYSYESPEQTKPSFDAKGIETVRRDTCAAVAKMFEQSLRILFEQQDISKVKEYLHHQWTRILRGKVSLQDFVFAKEVRLGTYRSSLLPPAALVASKAMRTDPRAEPHYGERIPYVVIHGEPGARLVDMVVDPLELLDLNSPYRLNDLYYINKQIIPALQRVFGLMGFDLNQWFLEMPRPVRPTLAKRQPCMSNSRSASELDGDDAHVISRKAPGRKTRIDYYYLSKHCAVCGGLVQGSNHLCNECSKKGPVVAAAMMGRTSKLEKDIQHLNAICGHCGGGDWIVELGVKCTSLACPVFYERRKVQKEFQSLSTVAAEVGFYPRCMVEWF